MNTNIICSGNIAYDIIPSGKPSRGEIPFLACPGGSVLNTSVILSRLGLPVSLLTKTGRGVLSNALLDFLNKQKIKTTYCFQNKNLKTSFAFADIDKQGNSSYTFYRAEGKDLLLRKDELAHISFKDTNVFHTGSAYAFKDFTFDNTLSLIDKAKKANTFITYDPNWRAKRVRDENLAIKRIFKILPQVDLLKLSEKDALSITGKKTLSAALKKLAKNIVVTLDGRGSFFWTGKKRILCPPVKTKVKDTIGAGDGFMAGVIYSYTMKGQCAFEEHTILESLSFASMVASLVCEKRGATEGVKSLAQVNALLKAHSCL